MNIRLKLDDVIDSNLIMLLLFEIIEKTPTKKVLFWHSDISNDDIDGFFTKWRSKTNVSLEICEDPTFKYAWFDIISQKDNQKLNTSHRFKYIYSTKDDIMRGIFNYYHTARFIISKKRNYKRRK